MLQRAMDEGAALPPHPVLVTFDDGFQDNVSNAAPILAEFGYSGTVFVATAYIGGTAQFCSREVDRQAPMLTGDDIARLENEYDWDVAHHFHSHRKLTDLSAQEIQSELASAQEVLRQYIAKTENVSYCAVPKDVMNETVRSTLRDDDATRLAFAGKGLAQRSSDMFGVPRVEIHNDQCGSDFLVRLSPTFQAMRAVKARM
jgi:peptidoglycan/xylan/chitin deacetylase (PgdA/CDA1 family)